MIDKRLRPEKITKPIQLLAAWLTGLVLVNGGFLTAAPHIKEPTWAAGVLVIAAVLNVPLFLVSLFLLQTRYRPEMQEDTYYSQYLERKYSTQSELAEPLDIHAYATELTENIIKEIGPSISGRREPIEKVIHDSQLQGLVRRKGNSRTLSELFLRPELWPAMVKLWGEDRGFKIDFESLVIYDLIPDDPSNPLGAHLTELGKQVAEIAQEKGILYSQTKGDKWNKEGQRASKMK